MNDTSRRVGAPRGSGSGRSRNAASGSPPAARVSRLIGLILIVALLGMLGWKILAVGVSDLYAETEPATALAWQPNNSDALAAAADQTLANASTPEDAAAVADQARQALLLDPLNYQAFRVLGLAADKAGDQAEAEALVHIAVDRWPRDWIGQGWLINHDVANGQYEDALSRIDTLLRVHFADGNQDLLPFLVTFADQPPIDQMVDHLLVTNPPWRAWFLTQFAKQGTDEGRVEAVYKALEASSHPPIPDEVRPYAERLVADGNFAEAIQAIAELAPPPHAADLGRLYNGSFELPLTGMPFDWAITHVAGAETAVVADPDAPGNHVLQVDFADQQVPFQHVAQRLALGPGMYRLVGRGRTIALANDHGLVWKIFCADDPTVVLGTTAPFKGSTPWTPLAVDFTVPQSGCEGQWLRLELPTQIVLQQRISGTAEFDDLAIDGSGDAPQSGSESSQ